MATALAESRTSGASPAFLRDSDMCRLLGITRTTLRRWIEQGEPLPKPVRIQGKRYWPRSQVEQFIRGELPTAGAEGVAS